jgi:RecJ-like exonuclease
MHCHGLRRSRVVGDASVGSVGVVVMAARCEKCGGAGFVIEWVDMGDGYQVYSENACLVCNNFEQISPGVLKLIHNKADIDRIKVAFVKHAT